MAKEKLFLNTLTFEYPSEPVKFYFSKTDDAERRSTRLASTSLVPAEVKKSTSFLDLFAGVGGFKELYTSYDLPLEGFEAVEIDFSNPENENLVKRYYNRRLERYFRYNNDVVVTNSGITKDIQVWVLNQKVKSQITYHGNQYDILQLDRFTLKVRFDSYNHRPYLLIALDRPAKLLNAPLSILFANIDDYPFGGSDAASITPRHINLVMTKEIKVNKEGNKYVVRRIDSYEHLHKNNKYCPSNTTRPIICGSMRRILGLDDKEDKRSFDSKYIKYYELIEWFRNEYLDTKEIERIFKNLAFEFTPLDKMQVAKTGNNKRMLVFGHDHTGCHAKNVRQQKGVNFGPYKRCPYSDVQLIAIFPKEERDISATLINYFRKDQYKGAGRLLSHYIGTDTVSVAPDQRLHIKFTDTNNPVPEIITALQNDSYRRLDPKVKYVGIYISPIHKYASEASSKECYYKIKELFLKKGIITQCIDLDKMKRAISADDKSGKQNFVYTLQNMGVAICAKLEGAPWILDETARKELIIGIGAFKSDNRQYIGAAFSFDNTGIFSNYEYFQKNELDELVGAIQLAIIKYASINNKLERLVIHYYKKISRKREFQKIEDMLSSLNLDIPVYIVTINKTESEDIVVFDAESKYTIWENGAQVEKTGYMPHSGTFVNLGSSGNARTYLLCNNTRYEGESFSYMDGFPFPIKLHITCPNRKEEIDTAVIWQPIDQVYQFSRIYWKSVKQQGLPVTIKYPEMIAEIMPHFNDRKVYAEKNCLWFL